MRLLRPILFYCVMSLVLVLPHLVMAWPILPQSVLDWLVFLFLPVPLVAAGEWLLQYRQLRFLQGLDQLGDYVHSSKYRLAIVVTILILAFLLCYLVVFGINILLL